MTPMTKNNQSGEGTNLEIVKCPVCEKHSGDVVWKRMPYIMQRKDYDESVHGDARYKTHACKCPNCDTGIVTDEATVNHLNSGPGALGIVLAHQAIPACECESITKISMVVPDLIKKWLKDNGYDGLYRPCCIAPKGCTFITDDPKDWMPCWGYSTDYMKCEPVQIQKTDTGWHVQFPSNIVVRDGKIMDFRDVDEANDDES